MNKLIVEYYGNRMKPEEDCYDIFCVDENGNKKYVCGGFNKDQVNVATFAINCYMTIESTKGISFKVDAPSSSILNTLLTTASSTV